MESHRLPWLSLLLIAAAFLAGCGGSDDPEPPQEPFRPSAELRAIGGTERTDKPAIVLRVAARPGDENIRAVSVTLPPVVLVDATAVGRLCTRRELRRKRCQGRERLGFARVRSPAYGQELSGPVYAVSGFGREFGLAYVLGGPPQVLLEGRILSVGGRIRAGVEEVPDTPLDSFELRIDGGPKGDLVLSRDICAAESSAEVVFESQEGQTRRQQVPFRADCG